MLIRKVILENFGLFRGRNEIVLAPKSTNGRKKPVILVGGKNGAGKTTLLEAVRLCLYGPLALGTRVSNRQYDRYLRSRVHRDETALIQLDCAVVGMQFEYAQCGKVHLYDVERSWEIQLGNVLRHLTVLRDGKALDELDQANADEFLRDLIPPGVSQLYFFDGEKIQQLAETEDDDVSVAEAVRGLLGLDLAERLQSDLRIYASRTQDEPGVDPLRCKLTSIEQSRQEFDGKRVIAQGQLDKSQARVDRLRQELAVSEQNIAREGGAFASQYEKLKTEKSQLLQSITDAEQGIRELCEGLLPFALAGPLCQSLRDQLEVEALVQAWKAQEQLLSERITQMKGSLEEYLFPAQARIARTTREQVTQRVCQLLEQLSEIPDELPSVALIHRLSEDQRLRLLTGIGRVLGEIPSQITAAHARLEAASRRLGEVENSLRRVPKEDQLQPLFDCLKKIHHDLADAGGELERNRVELKRIDLKLEELDREDRKLQRELADAEKGLDRRAMVAKVRSVLDEYSTALATQKARLLSEAVARRFAQLWRKGDVVRRIEIDPKTFRVFLFDRRDRVVPKRQLSAGEKQIYAISMLWALAEVSGRPLPIVIDTPLGRLDGDHRGHLVERYFPHASHQVIILSTDTEIDKTYFQGLTPAVSHAYHLRYDSPEGRSVVEKGYFWKKHEQELAHAH